MKFVLILVCVFASVIAAGEKYSSVNDNFDVSEVLGNERLLNSYVKCLLNKGPCTAEVKSVRDKLPEALETKCAKCTDRQKLLAKQLTREVSSRHPELWGQLVKHYDPTGKYQDAFQGFLKN